MNFLFVSTVAGGGSGLSQRQLARRLQARGHQVTVLAARDQSRVVRPLYERQVDLSTRLHGSRLRPALLALQRPMGRRVEQLDTPDHPTWVATVPENGYRALRRRFRPQVVVASSIDRVTWRRLRAQLQAEGIPSVLYLREASGLGHLTVTKAPPDLLLANAQSHAEAARALGYACEVVPSVVELDRARTRSAREVVLLVNPIQLLGGDRVWLLAAARPDISFVLQESGLLSDAQRDEVLRRLPEHPNVTVRPFTTVPADLYRDARVLLVPHHVDNRPRVVLEAQANGIPVLATAFPGLAESVGPGGILVDDDAPAEAWIDALGRMWDDPAKYEQLVAAALAHAARPDVDPDAVTARFEELVGTLVRDGMARTG
ncbi:MAG: glycosyltransferase [Actinobacteria bacterium]|nr:glycosyltransferase [Actinomycetota bacterium]